MMNIYIYIYPGNAGLVCVHRRHIISIPAHQISMPSCWTKSELICLCGTPWYMHPPFSELKMCIILRARIHTYVRALPHAWHPTLRNSLLLVCTTMRVNELEKKNNNNK